MSRSFGLAATAETSLGPTRQPQFHDAVAFVSAGDFASTLSISQRDRPVRPTICPPPAAGEPVSADLAKSFSGLAHRLAPSLPGGVEVSMDEARRDQINEHFAQATGLLEDAHEIAVAGQSNRASQEDLTAYAKALRLAVDRASAMVSVIEGLADGTHPIEAVADTSSVSWPGGGPETTAASPWFVSEPWCRPGRKPPSIHFGIGKRCGGAPRSSLTEGR